MTYRLQSGSAKAARLLSGQGLPLPEKPEKDTAPYIPLDLTSVEDADLMSLFSELTAWADYAAVQLAAAQVDERKAQKRVDRATTERMAAGVSQRGDRVTVLKAQAANDPEVTRLSDAVDEVYAYRKMVEALYNNFERDASLVSRELTRRTATNTAPRKRNLTA